MAANIAVSCQQTRFDISDSTAFAGVRRSHFLGFHFSLPFPTHHSFSFPLLFSPPSSRFLLHFPRSSSCLSLSFILERLTRLTRPRHLPTLQLDIKSLSITVHPSSPNPPSSIPDPGSATGSTPTPTSKPNSTRKKAVAADGLEILSNADLKLNPGVCYALVGKNGSGKSSKSHGCLCQEI